MARYYLGAIDDGPWQLILSRALDRADAFQVLMPDGEGPLSYGREQFLALPDLAVESSSRMWDAVVFSGTVTDQVRSFIASSEASLTEYDAAVRLWDFQLLSSGVEILSISDFTDLMIEATDVDMADLESAGVQTQGWIRIEQMEDERVENVVDGWGW
ncbi:hypothetical protein GCM10022223_31750 [Kineosporia mesophila]|uniref:DUF4265 domain-containing protein n=1 Tax=Kineosporia mesophila TaxID=566012 RepID=A0ABP6ZRW6_9ACTN|nr:hypothetical protein [Kineosporia mesophila]MCD5354498.1 hypothetical protein [Kineosporia mesophila]